MLGNAGENPAAALATVCFVVCYSEPGVLLPLRQTWEGVCSSRR